MPLYNQGENYEEGQSAPRPRARSRKPAPEPEVEEDVVEEEEEETPKKKKKKKQDDSGGGSMSPKLIACIVGLVVLLFLAGGLFLFVMGNKKDKEDIQQSKEQQEAQEAYENAWGDSSSETNMYSGQSDTSQQSTVETDPWTGGPVVQETQAQTTTSGESDTSSTSGGVGDFSAKTADTLRKWGFTNAQMEIASRDGISAEAMVEQAKMERKQAQYEAMMEAADQSSEAYQKLLNQTWLGQPPMDISGFIDQSVMYSSQSYTENVDYEKVEARGMQLWIKCYLKNGMTAFMQVQPARYNSLEDAGNIVVQYTVVIAGESQVITTISEYRVGG